MGDIHELVELTRFEDPDTLFGVYAPRQLFTETGGVGRLGRADELVEELTSNPHLSVIRRERGRIGNAPAARLTVSVRPYTGFPDFCSGPCVPLFPLPGGTTITADSDVNQRLSIASVAGQTIVVLERESSNGREFADTGSLLHTFRLERSGG